MRKTNKITFLFAIYFTLSNINKAQINIIPNGSFETHTICPTSLNSTAPDEITDAIGWYTINESPDYFNTCSTSTLVQIPNNFFGYQMPASGNSYCGFWAYQSSAVPPYREILAAKTSNTLIIGQKYFIKITVSLAEGYNSNCGVDKIGLRFSTVQHDLVSPPLINNFAHIYTNVIISDTINWTNIFSSFVADSNYQYVEIGNFFDDSNTNVQVLKPRTANWSYYYVDNICASTDSVYTKNWNALSENTRINDRNKNDNLSVSPNPCNSGILHFNIPLQNALINIIDMHGSTIKHVILESAKEIDVKDLKDGLYFINIRTPEYSITKKITIKN